MEEVVPDLFKVQGLVIGFQDLKVENYSQKKGMGINKFIDSESFSVGGHRWKIAFYPSGMSVEVNEAGDTSVSLWHVGGESDTDCSTPVWSLYEVFVVDQTGKCLNRGASLFTHLPPHGIPYIRPGYANGYAHFINNEDLTSYLKDDCLIIGVAVGVLTSERQPYLAISNSFIGADLGKLLVTKHGTDVIFEIGSETFQAHRSMLAARSSVFELTFSGDYENQPETITLDTDPRLFKAMLRFIYTDDLHEEKQESANDQEGSDDQETIIDGFMSDSFLGEMVVMAEKFGVSSLKKVCESRIMEMICVQGVSPLLGDAIDHGDHELREACLKFKDDQVGGKGCNSLQVNCQLLLSVLCKGKSGPPTHTWKDSLAAMFKDYLYYPAHKKQKKN